MDEFDIFIDVLNEGYNGEAFPVVPQEPDVRVGLLGTAAVFSSELVVIGAAFHNGDAGFFGILGLVITGSCFWYFNKREEEAAVTQVVEDSWDDGDDHDEYI